MSYILYIVILTLLQVFFFGRIHLFDVATPLVYTWFVLRLRRGTSKALGMALSFILGLAIDIFSNTPGLVATSLTFIACLQPYVLELFLRRDDEADFQPSLHTLGFMRYLAYSLILLTIYTLVYFTLGLLPGGGSEWLTWLAQASSSLLLTLVVVMAIDFSRKN